MITPDLRHPFRFVVKVHCPARSSPASFLLGPSSATLLLLLLLLLFPLVCLDVWRVVQRLSPWCCHRPEHQDPFQFVGLSTLCQPQPCPVSHHVRLLLPMLQAGGAPLDSVERRNVFPVAPPRSRQSQPRWCLPVACRWSCRPLLVQADAEWLAGGLRAPLAG